MQDLITKKWFPIIMRFITNIITGNNQRGLIAMVIICLNVAVMPTYHSYSTHTHTHTSMEVAQLLTASTMNYLSALHDITNRMRTSHRPPRSNSPHCHPFQAPGQKLGRRGSTSQIQVSGVRKRTSVDLPVIIVRQNSNLI